MTDTCFHVQYYTEFQKNNFIDWIYTFFYLFKGNIYYGVSFEVQIRSLEKMFGPSEHRRLLQQIYYAMFWITIDTGYIFYKTVQLTRKRKKLRMVNITLTIK